MKMLYWRDRVGYAFRCAFSQTSCLPHRRHHRFAPKINNFLSFCRSLFLSLSRISLTFFIITILNIFCSCSFSVERVGTRACIECNK